MAYGNFKNLERRGTSDKVLKKIKHITLSKHSKKRISERSCFYGMQSF